MSEFGAKRSKTVVIERQVTEEEYKQHVERMRSLGLGPNDVAPVQERERLDDAMIDEGKMVTIPPRASWEGMVASKKSINYRKLAKPFTLAEKIEDKKHVNALKKFAAQLDEWEQFRLKAAEVTRRDPNELVISRAEEYRELVELNDLLQRSAPADVQSGGHSWFHSLRGDGSRFIQVGNMFSGLFVPIRMHREVVDEEIKRTAWLRDMVKRRKEQTGPRTWRDDEYLLSRLRRYKKTMHELAPGKLDFDETLEICGKSLRPTEELPVEEESTRAKSESEDIYPAETNKSSRYAPYVVKPPEPSLGPHLELTPAKLEFHLELEEMKTSHFVLHNTGTVVLTYSLQEVLIQRGYELSTNPLNPVKHFRCRNPKGTIMPGSSTIVTFSFTSSTAGAFYMMWSLQTVPRLIHPIPPIPLHGLCSTKDTFGDARHQLQKTWTSQQIERGMVEIVNDVVEAITTSAYPDIELTEPFREQYEFERKNPMLYYNTELVSHFRNLAQRLHDLNPPPRKVKEVPAEIRTRGFRPLPVIVEQQKEEIWSLDTRDLWVKVNAVTDPSWRRQLKILERKARKKFVESAASYQICEELLLEAVELLPPLWAEARAGQELPERPRWPIEDPEEDLQKGEDEAEEAAMEAFVASFGEKLGDVMEQYADFARTARLLDVIHQVDPCMDGVNVVRTRQTVEDLDVMESIVFYEPDVSAIDDEETMKLRMQGLVELLEGNPMAMLIITTPDMVGKLLPIVKELDETVQVATPAVILEAIGNWEDGPPCVFVVDLEPCPQQNGVDPLGEPMTWVDRDVWFDINFPHAYDVYIMDSMDGLFQTRTLQNALGFLQPVRAMATLIGPFIESELDRVYKEILLFEHAEKEASEAGEKPTVLEPKLITFGGTGDKIIADLTILKSLLTCDTGPVLLLPPFSHLVCEEIFTASPMCGYFATLCESREIYIHGPNSALFCYINAPHGISFDPVLGKLLLEEREEIRIPTPVEEEKEKEEIRNKEEKEGEAEEPTEEVETQEVEPPPVGISLPDLLSGLLAHCGGILAVGSGVTPEFLDCVQTRVDKAPGEDDEDDDEEEEEDEDEDEEEEDEKGEKPPKEEKLGPFEFLGAIGVCADAVIAAEQQDMWTLSSSTAALRLLSTRPIGAETLNQRK